MSLRRPLQKACWAKKDFVCFFICVRRKGARRAPNFPRNRLHVRRLVPDGKISCSLSSLLPHSMPLFLIRAAWRHGAPHSSSSGVGVPAEKSLEMSLEKSLEKFLEKSLEKSLALCGQDRERGRYDDTLPRCGLQVNTSPASSWCVLARRLMTVVEHIERVRSSASSPDHVISSKLGQSTL